MANWLLTIDVSEEWAELERDCRDKERFLEIKKKLLVRLRAHKKVIQTDVGITQFYQFVGILNRLSKVQTIETFDKPWHGLYNWCDSNRVWLQTVKI